MSSRRPPSSIPPFERGDSNRPPSTVSDPRARPDRRRRTPAGAGGPAASRSRPDGRSPELGARGRARRRAGAGTTPASREVAEQGKLPVRERVERLDPESFAEEALLANWDQEGLGADGVVTGLALVGGRKVALMANDPTVKAGSWGPKTSRRSSASRSAIRLELPLVYLVDSAGARITEQVQMFPGRRGRRIFYNEVVLSGRVPQFASCLARARRAAPPSRPSATS